MLLLRVLLLAFIVLLQNKHTSLAENGKNLIKAQPRVSARLVKRPLSRSKNYAPRAVNRINAANNISTAESTSSHRAFPSKMGGAPLINEGKALGARLPPNAFLFSKVEFFVHSVQIDARGPQIKSQLVFMFLSKSSVFGNFSP